MATTSKSIKLKKRVKELEKALEFYRDAWVEVPYESKDGDTEYDVYPKEELLDDQGEIALNVLKKEKGTENLVTV